MLLFSHNGTPLLLQIIIKSNKKQPIIIFVNHFETASKRDANPVLLPGSVPFRHTVGEGIDVIRRIPFAVQKRSMCESTKLAKLFFKTFHA